MSFIERINEYKTSVQNRQKEKQIPIMLNNEYGGKIGIMADYHGIPKARLIKILIDEQWADLSNDNKFTSSMMDMKEQKTNE